MLRGQEVTPHQVAAEWLEYKLIFNDILTRFSAQLARNAKVERKRIVKQLEADLPLERPAPASSDRKAELRKKAAGMRGLVPMRSHQLEHNGNGEGA